MSPASGEVWLGVVFGVMVWSATLWLLQRLWRRFWDRVELDLASSVLYGWGLLLEENPRGPPEAFIGQVSIHH